ncbi:MAG: hypothetical protein QXR17_07735 [Candidatus Bathyarchaeia archaeon]
MGESKAKKAVLAVLAVAILVAAVFACAQNWTASIGYVSGFQGFNAEFAAIKWQGSWWSTAETPYGDWQPSVKQFGGSLLFDPDQAADGWCDLGATQRAITLRQAGIEPYEWTVQVDSVTQYKFRMEKVELSWQVNIFLDGTEDEAWDTSPYNPYYITWEPNYAGTQIWIKLKPSNFKYFVDNPDEFYIAPAYICLEHDAKVYAKDPEGKMIANEPRMNVVSISPNAAGEALPIYYARGGTPVNLEQQILSYKGKALDPAIFRNEYWLCIDLVNFKPVNWFDWMWHKWLYPSVQLNIKMYAFVVGKWTVRLNEQDIPQLNPHQTSGDSTGALDGIINWFKGVGAAVANWFANPLNALQFWMFLGVVVIIVLAVVAPGVLRGLGAVAEAGGKKLAKKIKGGRRK